MAISVLASGADALLAQMLELALTRSDAGGQRVLLLCTAGLEAAADFRAVKDRALAAWGRAALCVVCVYDAPVPLGFRDVPRLAWSPADDTQREGLIAALGKIFPDEVMRAPPPVPSMSRPSSAPAAAPSSSGRVAGFALDGRASGRILGIAAMLALAVSAYVYAGPFFVGGGATHEDPGEPSGAGVAWLVFFLLLAGGAGWAVWRRLNRTAAVVRAASHTTMAGQYESAALPPSVLFASYSHVDAARVDRLVGELERDGVDVWVDRRKLTGGERWPGEIVKAIRECRALMVFCSADSFASDHVYREVHLAASMRKGLIPVMLDPAPMPDAFLYYLAPQQAVTFDPPDQLKSAVRAALAGGA